MHRFFVDKPSLGCWGQDQVLSLSREESAHAGRVLRLKPGDRVELLDGENLYSAELVQVADAGVKARVISILPSPESKAHITLWQGLPKADKLETIMQKATELGVWSLWPVEMERSVGKMDRNERAKQTHKRERLCRIALEAAKQSGRAHVPQVENPCSFDDALARIVEGKAFDLIVVAWEEAQETKLSQAIRESASIGRILLVIGPEGGITKAEYEKLNALGARSVTLGRRILRTETAGPCALAVILATLDEM